jgi:hypothetical protein
LIVVFMAVPAYQYGPLSVSAIRLLSLLPGQAGDPLRGEIFDVDFSHHLDLTHYEALSYVWGHELSPHSVSIVQAAGTGAEGVVGTVSLGANLYSALCHLRLEHSPRTIWCDRLCIDQDNNEERACQVARMADVYQRAQRVIVWLGPEADDSALAMKAMRYTGQQVQIDCNTRTWQPAPDADPSFAWGAQHDTFPFSHAELEATQKLVARSWFKRLWTRQEITLAKTAVVVAGHDTLPWRDFISAGFFLDSLVRLGGRGDANFGRDLFNLYELGCLQTYQGLMEILHACRACECSEDVDRVYGILGLLSSTPSTSQSQSQYHHHHHQKQSRHQQQQRINIQPDYSRDKGAKSAYRDLVMESYRCSRRLDILALCEAPGRPSWVPDLNKLNLGTGLHTRVVPYCRASGEAAASLTLLSGGGGYDDNDGDAVEVHGVRCGVLGRAVVDPALRGPEALTSSGLRRVIREILREHMGGGDVSQWNRGRLRALVQGLLGSIWNERTGRKNHSSLAFAMVELQRWVLEVEGDPGGLSDDDSGSLDTHSVNSRILFNHISRVLFRGDSCRLVQDHDGRLGLGLGFDGCREGDVLYTVLGCRRLITLRREPGRGPDRYRVIGKFDHPRYNDGEALFGDLGTGWSAQYQHGLRGSNRPMFAHDDGTWQWQDPRLQSVALPRGWREGEDQNGYPYWFQVGQEDEPSDSDPRLTCDELRKRGVKVERLVIV